MLQRISSLASGRRSKWAVLAVWVLLALALGPLQPRLQEATVNEPEAFLPRAAEATRVAEILKQRFPEGRDVPAVLVYAREGGLKRADRRKVVSDARAVSRPGLLQDAQRPLVPFQADGTADRRALEQGLISRDRSTAVTLIPMGPDDSDELMENVDRIRNRIGAGDAAGNDGLEVHVTGPAGLSVDAIKIFESIDKTLLIATVLIILTLLLLVYRSPMVALVPLIVVGLAYAIAAGIVYAVVIEALGLEVNGQTTAILIVLMFGAGTDYCLLIVSRFREELRRRADKHEAMAAATARTAPAILSAGGTVFAAMLVLLVASLKSTQNLGPVLAIGIAVILLAGLTLLPALLAIFGRTSFWPAIPRLGSELRSPFGIWNRIGHLIHDRPVWAMAASIAFLGLGALGNFVHAEKLSFGAGFRDVTDSTQGSDVLERKLPAGEAGTSTVLVRDAGSQRVARALSEASGVAAVRDQSRSTDGRLVRLAVVLDGDPFSDAMAARVPELRRVARRAAAGLPAVEAGGPPVVIGGVTAENTDTYAAISDDGRVIVPAVLGVVLLILILLLRAVIAPLYLVATVVLSFGFALGASRVIFTQILGQDAIEPALATFAFIFLVALGVDYNIFLISRVREEHMRLGIKDGVISALEKTGGVITSAGLILAGTFMTLAILPLESLLQVGATIALGLLVDTFLVRVILVPSIAFQLGELNWWPARMRPPGTAGTPSSDR